MSTFELEEYLETHSSVVDEFRDKYEKFLSAKNASRSTDKQWSSLRIENTTDKVVSQFVTNVRNKLAAHMGAVQRKKSANWVIYIEKNGIIESLEESMMDMEFED